MSHCFSFCSIILASEGAANFFKVLPDKDQVR